MQLLIAFIDFTKINSCYIMVLLLLLLSLLLLVGAVLVSLQYKNWLFVWRINGWRGVLQQPYLWWILFVYLEPKSLLHAVTHLRRQFKRPLAIIFGSRVLLYVDDPAIIEQLLNAPEARDKSLLQDGFYLQRGVLHARGAKWKQRRRQLDPAFSTKTLLSFIDIFNEVGNKLVQKFEVELQGNAMPFNAMEALLCRAVLEVSCLTIMGHATNLTQQDTCGIARTYSELMELSALRGTKPWLQNDYLFRLLDSKHFKRGAVLLAAVERFVQDIVQQKYAEWQQKKRRQSATATTTDATVMHATGTDGTNTMDTGADGTKTMGTAVLADAATDSETATASGKRIFIEQIFHLVDTGEMPQHEIMDEALSMLMVSFETVSTSLGVALLCLAMHPDCQRKLRNELKTTLAGTNKQKDISTATIAHIDAEQLLQLKYLDMVMHESLRLLTTVPFNTRQVTQNFNLRLPTATTTTPTSATVTLPRGTAILIDTFNMQREVAYWGSHAQHFHPEHFAASATQTQRHPYAFIPFSKGVRYCIGGRYAMYLSKLFLAKLIYHFEFETTTKLEDLVFVNGISLKFGNSDRITMDIQKAI